MNRSNAKVNVFAVEQLDPNMSDRILEIGFGGGGALRSLIASAAYVAGVDPSRTVVERARVTFGGAIAAGRADFREGRVEALPFGAASFDKVCTVNTIYFWSSLDKGFAEIDRVLSPGGRIVVGFLPREWMDRIRFPSDIFISRAPADVIVALGRAGFDRVRVERPAGTTPWKVIVATANNIPRTRPNVSGHLTRS